jgi:hypothetical protein
MALFLAWWTLLCHACGTLLSIAYWSLEDRSGRLHQVVERINKRMDAVDAKASSGVGGGGGGGAAKRKKTQ